MLSPNPFAPATAGQPVTTGTAQTTAEHAAALSAVLNWHRSKNRKQIFRLFGPAGTGKSTLAKAIASQIGGKILFGAFSGKAASVLRAKGCDGADTIHRLIYQSPHKDSKDQLTFVLNEASPVRTADLVIIDEVSMVDAKLGKDLERFDRPILVLGDRHQLPPVKGKGYFIRAAADVELTTVLRQRENNPIVKLANEVRSGKQTLDFRTEGTSAVIRGVDINPETVLRADQVLVGLNETRHRFNARIRELVGRPAGVPTQGDKLVCLKNNPTKGLFNGDICFVSDVLDIGDAFVRMHSSTGSPGRSAHSLGLRAPFVKATIGISLCQAGLRKERARSSSSTFARSTLPSAVLIDVCT
ncbi:AAA family ATPase [Bradyrhizobium sp. 159]|uniref:ATP-dependent DNA helicase n=1 Tax=Bradyrhizobium sp. 159 TaxID=2782632 RepID=UPI001FFB0885|nr:ATP-dependent RecD-like DNA helicase [Bradyrhizobium sp. 159]MCK1621043.1 AAA family ATPase [Bradyrhizobium sp. 159]